MRKQSYCFSYFRFLKSRKAPLTGWQIGWSKDIRNAYYCFRNPGNFSFINHIGLVCTRNFCQASTLGFQDSGMKIFACGIRNLGTFFLGFGIRNLAQGIRAPADDWNPEPILRWQGTKNYLKLHGAKKDVLLQSMQYEGDVLFFVSLRRSWALEFTNWSQLGITHKDNIALQRTGTGWKKD